ncbi:thioesterase family protein [Prauserella muralis]|uniref:TesB-like acyl-CoA thioesterase 5 n=1 Tax=Prauserella muralis TaxID=588067 RepID=A0A2V4APC3_9PSEU|nr:thioesterase family protein [Prauserella muralis]PXY22427.1 TesB-like acyl-CoA thioesterase 5 [Prauserella muralis]TWE28097.1 thioesterase superfamily protein [Prauserella muralis]
MTDAFYLPLGGGRFQPTQHTSGPWSPDAQHFGPPSALLVRALEELPAERETMLARVTIEILGPAPLAELAVRAVTERPGRSVELLSAELTAGGRPVARAAAWRLATADTSEQAAGSAPALPPAEDCPQAAWPSGWGSGYLDAMEWRSAGDADIARPGPATVWARQRVPLVDGEKPSPLQRLFTVADSGNGVSNRLDWRAWLFINSELTVHVQREPSGEWIGLDAATVIGPHGVGTARSTLHDAAGQVANGSQALLVRRR